MTRDTTTKATTINMAVMQDTMLRDMATQVTPQSPGRTAPHEVLLDPLAAPIPQVTRTPIGATHTVVDRHPQLAQIAVVVLLVLEALATAEDLLDRDQVRRRAL